MPYYSFITYFSSALALQEPVQADLSRPRNLACLSIFSLAGSYLVLKSRTLATKQRENGDFSVTVDRSGSQPTTATLWQLANRHQAAVSELLKTEMHKQSDLSHGPHGVV